MRVLYVVQRYGEDIAGGALFFASPAARHITGETLLVDAGSHLGAASLAMR